MLAQNLAQQAVVAPLPYSMESQTVLKSPSGPPSNLQNPRPLRIFPPEKHDDTFLLKQLTTFRQMQMQAPEGVRDGLKFSVVFSRQGSTPATKVRQIGLNIHTNIHTHPLLMMILMMMICAQPEPPLICEPRSEASEATSQYICI